MFRRLARLALVGALAASTLAVVGGDVASGQAGPTGYTVGGQLTGRFPDCEFFSVDLITGALTQISDPTTVVDCADGLTFAPDGTLYAYTNSEVEGLVNATLVTIDPSTGAQTEIGPLPGVAFGDGGMTFDTAGNLWLYATAVDPIDGDCGTNGPEACLFQVDPATAAATFVGKTSTARVGGLTARCTPDEVLAIIRPNAAGIDSGTEIKRVDRATGALDLVVDLPDTFGPTGLDFDAAGGLWALAGTGQNGIGPMETESIDLTTGTSTHTPVTIGGDPFSGFLFGLAISPISCPAPPPEPAPEIVLAPTFTG